MAAFEIKLLLHIYLGVLMVDRILVYLLVLSALPFEILLLTYKTYIYVLVNSCTL